ncbi:hypothetical protein GCM10007938_41210 [Vibrio zhanjiangensis]|uniref:DegT/DnrJ/EryC1/StrS aminotransferase family protein n=1 Tax=Vibrio zhanjiangensis TaxID=1046128 RepID=A0ABQ6F6L4_9VIBR|nr:DegT/DnrJ/EryC1/StrS family aminotransferase [Vibrio zhanjiangensis]GLT20337.1 hypothetical protein GCM10007938_41210 [Vibrio zhanjiangensis]
MKTIPLNDTSRLSQIIISEAMDDISNIIKSGRWLLGDYTTQFANYFASYIGSEFCIPVANGTDALVIALQCLSKSGRNQVITVANAGGYTSTACYLSGHTPVYIDVHEDSMLMDISLIDDLLNENTSCVVATHLYGRTEKWTPMVGHIN